MRVVLKALVLMRSGYARHDPVCYHECLRC